jgi:L-aminopeptidase/D-esterase-like protein
VVCTDATLDKVQAQRLAMMAHDGLARTIDPLHTPADGDAMFALATGAAGRTLALTVLGSLAGEATARAVLSAIHHATGLPGLPAARDLAPPV